MKMTPLKWMRCLPADEAEASACMAVQRRRAWDGDGHGHVKEEGRVEDGRDREWDKR